MPTRFCWCCEKGANGRSYNIGGENERSNIDLVRTICTILDEKQPKASGSYADQISFVTDRPGHDARYAIDPCRIRRELGWRPSVTLEQGLERTVQWYLDNAGLVAGAAGPHGRRPAAGGKGMTALVFGQTGQVAPELGGWRPMPSFWAVIRPTLATRPPVPRRCSRIARAR